MSLRLSSLLSFQLPSSYDDVRLHHAVCIYLGYQAFATSGLCQMIAKHVLSLTSKLTEYFIPLIQYGIIPDFLIRYGIRVQLSNHLQQLRHPYSSGGSKKDMAANIPIVEALLQTKMEMVETLSNMPIAVDTDKANEQHYEVPAAFYDYCLGPCKKYSSGYWPDSNSHKKSSCTFPESEIYMLELYCKRAGITDSDPTIPLRIVDLGCGWGSLSLYVASKYPHTIITGISNSHSQREYIMTQAKERKLSNVSILTCNVANDTEGVLQKVRDNDIVMTVEMFEHMKNYSQLFELIYTFLKPKGKLFVHIFTHYEFTYHFDSGWMSDNFFSGGTMPSDDLLLYFTQQFYICNHWRVNGTHYERTSNAWLDKLDKSWKEGKKQKDSDAASLQSVLKEAYGIGKEREWYVNWRLFFLACAELWGYDNGNEWIVSHYLFQKR